MRWRRRKKHGGGERKTSEKNEPQEEKDEQSKEKKQFRKKPSMKKAAQAGVTDCDVMGSDFGSSDGSGYKDADDIYGSESPSEEEEDLPTHDHTTRGKLKRSNAFLKEAGEKGDIAEKKKARRSGS